MNALVLNRILIGCLFLLVIAGGGSYYIARNFLDKATLETSHKQTDASLESEKIKQLTNLKAALESQAQSVERAQKIVSDSVEYKYQDQVIDDIRAYAARTGVDVIGYTFNDISAATPTNGSPAPGAPAAPPSPSSVLPNGVTATQVTLTLKNPVLYTDMLRFIMAIEQNLTRMQITGISMTADKEDPTRITSPTIGLKVYLRSPNNG